MKQTLITFLIILCLKNVLAQSHNLQQGSACKLSKNRCVNTAGCLPCGVCDNKEDQNKKAKKLEDQKRIDEKELFGALAVDRSNGFYFGWSYDFTTKAEAEKRAVDECTQKGGNCSVVLSFLGSGCAAYRTINGKVGTAFGWGTSDTKEKADAIATQECMKRSKGTFPTNFVWACNSFNKRPIKELYNAKDEISDINDTLPMNSVHAIAFSYDGKKFATGSDDGIIRIWSMPSFSLISMFHIDPSSTYFRNIEISDVVFSPDGKILVTANGDYSGKVKVWNALTGKLIKVLDKDWGGHAALSFSPNGKYLASGGDCKWAEASKLCPGKIHIWDASTWELGKTLNGHSINMRSTSFSSDSKILASSSLDATSIFWDVETGEKRRILEVAKDAFAYNNYGQVAKGVFSPNGQTFITITWDINSKIKLWDAATGSLLKTLPGHGVFGESISYFNSNTKAVSVGSPGGGNNSTMIIWDLNSGAKLTTRELAYSGWKVAVSIDGTIATSGAGGLELWKTDEKGNIMLWKQIKRDQIIK